MKRFNFDHIADVKFDDEKKWMALWKNPQEHISDYNKENK